MNIRTLSAYSAAALGVQKTDRAPLVGTVDAPASEVSDRFPYQSYFDDTALARALLPQPANDPIVPSTLRGPIQQSGYALALHPCSETPVAVRFFTGEQQGASQVYRLSPGEVVRPFGSPAGRPGAFSGFEYGLPFGWLGGGSVLFVVLRTPDAFVAWNGRRDEVIFHRLRLKILAPADIPTAANLIPNWPTRFPWVNATRLTSSVPLAQRGAPALSVQTTRVKMRLRLATLGGAADMRMVFVGTNDFDWGGDVPGTTLTTSVQTFVDVTWPVVAGVPAAVNLTSNYPVLDLTSPAISLGCDEGGGVVLVSDDANLQNQYVDIVRYGKLG